jgi:hypothetical protein
MSQVSTLTRFNNTIDCLIDSLIDRYSHHEYFGKELRMTKEKFSLLRKTNPAKIVEGVLVKVYPYKKQIMDEDDEFFVQKSYDSDTKNEGNLVKVLKIKELWDTDMDENTKKTLFNYFKVLIVLAEKYVAEKVSTN